MTGFNKSCQFSLLLVCGLVYHKVHLLFNGCLALNSSLVSKTVLDSKVKDSVWLVNSSDIWMLV